MNTPIMDESDLVKLCQELTKELEQCRLERDEAQAKCAQMREALTKIKSSGHTMFPRTVDYALSTDCGNGWKSPEEYAALEAKCAEMRLMLMQLYSEEFEMGYITDQHGYKECGHCGGLDDHRPGCIQLAIEKALSTDCGKALLQERDELRALIVDVVQRENYTDPAINILRNYLDSHPK